MGVDLTPAMQQYVELKGKHRDCILMCRMGDFYEMFFDDAVIAARELNITLTTRNKNREDAAPLAGFPYHAASNYVGKLIARGYKVAICEQLEDPKTAKGLVKRDVVRIITPGLPVGAENTLTDDNVFLAAIESGTEETFWGAAFLDLSTGELYLAAARHREELIAQVSGVNFREVIMREDCPERQEIKNRLSPGDTLLFGYLPGEYFAHPECHRLLTAFFTDEQLTSLDLFRYPALVCATGAILRYAQETQKTTLGHIRLRWYERDGYLILDDTARRNLELFSSLMGNTAEGSLLKLLDDTETALGKRLLRRWLAHPLRDAFRINERLEAVAALKEQHLLRGHLRQILKGIYDLERLAARIAMQSATARDLIALRDSLKELPALKSLLADLTPPLIVATVNRIDLLADIVGLISRALVDSPPAALGEGGTIRPGYDEQFDALLLLIQDGASGIAALEEKERRRTGISSLKVGYNNVFGYYFEISKARPVEIPADYVRKQTLVNAERYINQELKEYEDRVLQARERIKEREQELFVQLRQRLTAEVTRIQSQADCIALLDVLATLAEVAVKYNYCRPEVDNSLVIEIEDGRHPVVERMPLAEGFVPNDLKMNGDDNRFLVITGPNMAGKSTYIRQVALTVIMAQMGGFVPAKSARIGVVDRIFTRLGAADNLSRGQSTFMVEMIEVASILKNATGRSLVILDEVGRGTGTFDGIAIAWAVAEYLHDAAHLRSRTLFATHYHQLTDLSMTKMGIKNYHIAVRESPEGIVFLRKIIPGGTNRSYGIHVARLAGLPEDTLNRAREILENMEKRELDESGQPALARRKRLVKKEGQLSIFDEE